MSTELTPKTAMSLTEARSTQTGKNNVYVDNQPGATVNFNYSYPVVPNYSEMLVALQSFSHEYYQLIVTQEDIFDTENTSGSITVGSTRALTKGTVPPEIYERCSTLTDAGKEELKTLPAIICQENTAYHGNTDPKQMAIYGYITKIKNIGKEIKIYYRPIQVFRQQVLCKNGADFGLYMNSAITSLNESGWTVKKIDLFEAFRDVGLGSLPMPD